MNFIGNIYTKLHHSKWIYTVKWPIWWILISIRRNSILGLSTFSGSPSNNEHTPMNSMKGTKLQYKTLNQKKYLFLLQMTCKEENFIKIPPAMNSSLFLFNAFLLIPVGWKRSSYLAQNGNAVNISCWIEVLYKKYLIWWWSDLCIQQINNYSIVCTLGLYSKTWNFLKWDKTYWIIHSKR